MIRHLLITSLLVAGAMSAAAQDPVPQGAFVGFIRNTVDSGPVRSADVRLYFIDSTHATHDASGQSAIETFIDSTRSRLALSNETGYFAIWRLRPGRYLLAARRIGFAPGADAIVTVDSGTVVFDFTMVPVSPELAKVEIREQSEHNSAARRQAQVGFESRQKFETGQFIKPADIEKRKLLTLRDVLQTYGVTSSAQFFVDKMSLSYDDIQDYPADLIAGIEVYRHVRPMEYGQTRRGATVAQPGGSVNLMQPLVLIWTYIP